MLLELLLSAAAVYGATAVYKAGKSAFGGTPTGKGFQDRNGKWVFQGKKYDTIEDFSAAIFRQNERDRLQRVDEMKSIGLDGPLDEDDLRRKVREWDEKGL